MRKYQLIKISTVLLWLLLPLTLQSTAAPLPAGAFTAEVAVNGQSGEEQLSAFRVAMRIILLQNSPDESLLNRPAIQRALIEADRYVDQNEFRVPGLDDRITRATPMTRKVRQTNEATHLLSVQFNRELISGLITQELSQLTPGDEEDAEPQLPSVVLTWLLVDDGNGEHRIGGPTGPNVMERAREIAGAYGIQLVFPEQDAEDLLALSVLDIESGNQQSILSASSRYQQQRVMTGLIRREQNSVWSAQWRQFWLDSSNDVVSESPSLDQALQIGIRWLATPPEQTANLEQTQASASAASSSFGGSSFGQSFDRNTAAIWIDRLQSAEGYASVIQLIEETESVESAYPAQMLPSGVLIAITPRVALNDVVRELNSVSWLRSTQVLDPNTPRSQLSNADGFYEYLR